MPFREENSLVGRVHFEPGVHPISIFGQEDVLAKVKAGQQTSQWNAGVGHRIGSYKPDYLAIDGLTSFDPDDHNKVALSIEDKALIWSTMPGFPRELNGTDAIMVVAGDTIYNEPNGNKPGELFLRAVSGLGSLYIARGAGKIIDEARQSLADQPPVSVDPVKSTEAESKQLTANKKSITRRTFLRNSAALAALAVISANTCLPRFGHETAVRLDGDLEHVPQLRVDKWVDEDNLNQYVNGRTALLLTKMSELATGKSVGCVLMGSGHFPGAQPLLRSASKRCEAIRLHTSLMANALSTDTSIFAGSSTEQERYAELYLEQTSATLISFTQPDLASYRADPLREIDRVVNFQRQIVSPTISAYIQAIMPKPK